MSPERRSSRDEAEGGYPSPIGRAIKLVRTGRAIGRRELAARAGLSYSYLSEIENGAKQPSTKALAAIADALDLPIYELMATAETWRESTGFEELEDSVPETTRTLRRLMSPDEAPRSVEPWPSRVGQRLTRTLGARSQRERENLSLGARSQRERENLSLGARSQRERENPSLGAARMSELVGLFTDLSAEDQERVLDMVRRLAAED